MKKRHKYKTCGTCLGVHPISKAKPPTRNSLFNKWYARYVENAPMGEILSEARARKIWNAAWRKAVTWVTEPPRTCLLILLTLAGLSRAESVTVAFLGDVKFAKTTARMVEKHGYRWPFREIHEELANADFRVANLESTGGPRTTLYVKKSVLFTGPLDQLQALKYGGFDLVSLGNNHALDYGPENLLATRAALDKLGIKHVGSTLSSRERVQYEVLTAKNGLRVAFLAFCSVCPQEFAPGTATAGVWSTWPTIYLPAIRRAREDADFVVVLPHWGYEYGKVQPYQVESAKKMVSAGADAVVGAHAHIPQQIAQSLDYVVANGLGNAFFGTSFQAAWDGLLLKIRFTRGKRPAIKLIPLNTQDQPRLASGEQAQRILYLARTGYDHKGSHEIPKTQNWTSEPLALEELW